MIDPSLLMGMEKVLETEHLAPLKVTLAPHRCQGGI